MIFQYGSKTQRTLIRPYLSSRNLINNMRHMTINAVPYSVLRYASCWSHDHFVQKKKKQLNPSLPTSEVHESMAKKPASMQASYNAKNKKKIQNLKAGYIFVDK